MATNRDTGRLTIFDLLFCMAIATFVGAALFAIFTDDPGKWATKNGRSDWLGFSGAIIGSAVTGMSIYAAWRHGSKQLASHKELENWKVIFEIYPRIEGDEAGLMAASEFIDYIHAYLVSSIPDSEIFGRIVVNFSDIRKIGYDIDDEVNRKLISAPDDIKRRAIEIVKSCDHISKIAIAINNLPAGERPEGWDESTRINRANLARRCETILQEISIRLKEIDDLRFLFKEGRARAMAQIRQSIQSQSG